PAGPSPGQLTETIADTVTGSSWAHTYAGVDMQSAFRINDVSGRYAYAGFTASTGDPNSRGAGYVFGQNQSTQDVLNWSWHDGTENESLPYRARFTLAAARTTAA